MKLLIIALLITSCSHKIKVKTPSNKFLSAESQGKPLKGQILLSLGHGTTTELDLENSKTDNSLSTSTEDQDLFDLIVTGEIGIWGPLDLVHISGGTLGADMTGVKYQFIGAPRLEAKKGQFSTSMMAGYGKIINNQEEGEDLELVPTDDDTTTELTISNQTVGLLTSYRINDSTLVSLSHYITNHNFHGDLESQNSGLDGKTINYSALSNNTTLGIQTYISSAFILSLEASSEKIKWDYTDESHVVYGNFGIGAAW